MTKRAGREPPAGRALEARPHPAPMPRLAAALSALVVLAAGCDSAAPPLDAEDVAGIYVAEFFDLYRERDGARREEVDVLARGGAAVVTLAPDGTARVAVSIPDGLPGAGRVDAATTYTLRTTDVGGAVTGARVRFADLPAPLPRDLPWSLSDRGIPSRLSLGATSGEPWEVGDGWTGRVQLARVEDLEREADGEAGE